MDEPLAKWKEGFSGGAVVKNLPANAASIPESDSLEKEMASHSSIPAWEILWTEKPSGLVYGVVKESDITYQLNNSPKDARGVEGGNPVSWTVNFSYNVILGTFLIILPMCLQLSYEYPVKILKSDS